MAILRVDTEAMATGASRIQNALDEIDGLLTLLNGDVNDMLSAWAGPAASAHREMHVRFQGDAKQIHTSLSEMHAALLRTHGIYVNQESAQNSDHTVMTSQITA